MKRRFRVKHLCGCRCLYVADGVEPGALPRLIDGLSARLCPRCRAPERLTAGSRPPPKNGNGGHA